MNQRKCMSCGAAVTGDQTACLLCGAPMTVDARYTTGEVPSPPGTRLASAMDLEILAFTISAGKWIGVLQNHEAGTLQAELMAADTAGTWWTFMGGSRKWFRSQAGGWVEADAPAEIFLKEDVFDRLQRMTRDTLERVGTLPARGAEGPAAQEVSAGPDRTLQEQDTTPAEATGTPLFCGKCGKGMRPGKKFCVSCGTPAGFGLE